MLHYALGFQPFLQLEPILRSEKKLSELEKNTRNPNITENVIPMTVGTVTDVTHSPLVQTKDVKKTL